MTNEEAKEILKEIRAYMRVEIKDINLTISEINTEYNALRHAIYFFDGMLTDKELENDSIDYLIDCLKDVKFRVECDEDGYYCSIVRGKTFSQSEAIEKVIKELENIK